MPAWEFSRFRAIAERGTSKLATPLPAGKTAGQQKIEDLDTCVRGRGKIVTVRALVADTRIRGLFPLVVTG